MDADSVVLPRKLTDEMVRAMEESDLPIGCSMREYHQATWDAAIAAAPAAAKSYISTPIGSLSLPASAAEVAHYAERGNSA